MALVYKKTYPIHMPPGAEITTRHGKKVARWESGKGQFRTAEVLDDGRVMFVSDCWYIRYRDADGTMRRASTGCRDKQSAEKFLADTLAGVDKMKVGIITEEEREVADHGELPVETHVKDYLEHLSRKRIRGRKVSETYQLNTRIRLNRMVKECGFRRLKHITREKVERWLDAAETEKGLAAATRNEYLVSISAFCAWAKKNNRMSRHPLLGIGKADRSADRRRVRRALPANDVATLLEIARLRPIAEVGRSSVKVPRGTALPDGTPRKRSSWTYERLTPDNFQRCYVAGLERLATKTVRRKRLERLGRQRAMFYLLAVSTGFRRKEIATLTVGQLHLDETPPHLALGSIIAKNARETDLPLRDDVIEKLREYLADYPARFGQLSEQGDTRGMKLDAKLFDVAPTINIYNADIQAAGIAKLDARGRVTDIHGFRHTFGTHMSAAGVHPRITMAAMRHSRIELTMNLYTDPALLDVAGAVNALPNFITKPTTPPPDPGTATPPAA